MTLIDKAEALAFVRDPQAREDIAALPARGVRVKPLVWRGMKTPTGVEAYDAQALIGRYKAQKSPTVDYAICVTPNGGITRHLTLDAAKAAAQADYEARILAALEPAALTHTDAAQVDHEGLLDWLGSFPPPNDKLRQMYADYQKAISDGRLKVAPTDAAQAREAALWEAWNVVWEAKTLLDAKNALHALIGEERT